jgi:hypothetical protein
MTAPRMTAWLLLHPGIGSTGWTGHWLDFDLIVQGRTLAHAQQVALESAAYFLSRPRPAGPETPRFRPAPAEDWARLDRVMDAGGVVGDLASLPDGTAGEHAPIIEAVAANYSIDMTATNPRTPDAGRGAGPEVASAEIVPFRTVVVFVLQGRSGGGV